MASLRFFWNAQGDRGWKVKGAGQGKAGHGRQDKRSCSHQLLSSCLHTRFSRDMQAMLETGLSLIWNGRFAPTTAAPAPCAFSRKRTFELRQATRKIALSAGFNQPEEPASQR
jgi:hypothetical protein